MGYVDPQSIHNPATSTIAPASWGDTLRDDVEFFIQPPLVDASNNAVQSINNTTWTTITLNSEAVDNDSMHSTVSNTSRLTCVTAGVFLVFADVYFAASTAGSYRGAQFLVNGATTYDGTIVSNVNSGSIPTRFATLRRITLAAADYVELQLQHDVGAAHNVQAMSFGAYYLSR